jgi:hypothetical protein
MRKKLFEEQNPAWKGNKVGYLGLHDFVKSRLPKPALCEECHKVPPYDLANKGTYDRDLSHWEWLCRKCHMTKDGRLKKLIEKGTEVSKANKGKKQTQEHIKKRIQKRMTGIKIKCKACPNEFYIPKCRIGIKKYCSRECFNSLFK